MEPRWAVNYFPAQGVARIGYLFGYYKDCGPPPDTTCDYSGHWSKHCTGHQGDSEFVLADVKFDATTNHWVLDRATLSAHFGEEPILGGIISSGDYTETVTWSNLQFPARSRAHFRVWVSRDKHANYRNQSTCNSGGTLNIDDCSSHSTAIENRLSIANNANVGSAAVPMIDCVDAIGTQAPFRTRTECYWSNPWRFTGWWDPAPDGSVSEVNSAMGYGMEVLPVLMEEYCWTLFCF